MKELMLLLLLRNVQEQETASYNHSICNLFANGPLFHQYIYVYFLYGYIQVALCDRSIKSLVQGFIKILFLIGSSLFYNSIPVVFIVINKESRMINMEATISLLLLQMPV